MSITREMIEALADLHRFSSAVKADPHAHPLDKDAALAIDLLDNEGFFVAITDKADELEAEAVAPDPAEWGDTTREDMARHQGAGEGVVYGQLPR